MVPLCFQRMLLDYFCVHTALELYPARLLRLCITTKWKVHSVSIGHSVQSYRTKRMAWQQHKSIFTVTVLQRKKVSKDFQMSVHLPQLLEAQGITGLVQWHLPVLIIYTVLLELTNSKKNNFKTRTILVVFRVPKVPAWYSKIRWNSSLSCMDSGGTTTLSSSSSWSLGPTGPQRRI